MRRHRCDADIGRRILPPTRLAMRSRLLLSTLTLFALLMPGSLRAQVASTPCEAVAADTTRFGAQPVYRECAVSKPATMRKVVEPKFDGDPGLTCASATLEFVVDANGRANPASVRVLTTNAGEFAKLLIASLEKWRFNPAELDKQKVAQLFLMDHSQLAANSRQRTAYIVGADGRTGEPVRTIVSGKSPSCEP